MSSISKHIVKNVDPHQQSGPLVVAMNIINLGSGQPVDPEDWSPERTQAVRLTRARADLRADLDDRIDPERRLSYLHGGNSQTRRLYIDESTGSEFSDSSDGQATY